MTATPVNTESWSGIAMKAVLLYDVFAILAIAAPLLELLSPPPDKDFQWEVKSYRFDQLQQPNQAEAALGEAADADLLAVAVGGFRPLPLQVASWLDTWAVHRRFQDPDFIVLWSGGSSSHTPAGVWRLRQFTQRHGLSCVCEDDLSENDESASFTSGDLEIMEPSG